jgi:Putative Ig domain
MRHIAVLLRRVPSKIKRSEMNLTSISRLIAFLICFCSVLAAQGPPLAIPDQSLPALDTGVEFHVLLHATGGVPPYAWSVDSGNLPEGISLTREGLLAGRPAKPGSFAFVLKVEDSAHPANTINREFQGEIAAPLLLEWLDPPKVHDDRIDGTVQVSNGSKDTFDLTVIIVAVAENGRATVLGYEHFPLKAGVANRKILFGSTLPYGNYDIRADAIAEIAARNTILRQGLQTPNPLQIVESP